MSDERQFLVERMIAAKDVRTGDVIRIGDRWEAVSEAYLSIAEWEGRWGDSADSGVAGEWTKLFGKAPTSEHPSTLREDIFANRYEKRFRTRQKNGFIFEGSEDSDGFETAQAILYHGEEGAFMHPYVVIECYLPVEGAEWDALYAVIDDNHPVTVLIREESK